MFYVRLEEHQENTTRRTPSKPLLINIIKNIYKEQLLLKKILIFIGENAVIDSDYLLELLIIIALIIG